MDQNSLKIVKMDKIQNTMRAYEGLNNQINLLRLSVGSAYTNVQSRRVLARWKREYHQKNRLGELIPNPKRRKNDIQILIIPLFTIITTQVLSYYSRIVFF